jgi:hypothetical protein
MFITLQLHISPTLFFFLVAINLKIFSHIFDYRKSHGKMIGEWKILKNFEKSTLVPNEVVSQHLQEDLSFTSRHIIKGSKCNCISHTVITTLNLIIDYKIKESLKLCFHGFHLEITLNVLMVRYYNSYTFNDIKWGSY